MRTSISYQSIHNYTVRNSDTIPNQGIENKPRSQKANRIMYCRRMLLLMHFCISKLKLHEKVYHLPLECTYVTVDILASSFFKP